MKFLVEAMNENFATKLDIHELKSELKAELKQVEWRLDSKIQTLESNIREMEYKLTIKLGSMMALSIGLTATLVKMLQSGTH